MLIMFYKFILHIGNSEWTSKELFEDSSCEFPSLRSHSIDFSKWLIDVSSSLEPHEFLVVTALVQRVMALSLYDTRDTVFFANDFLSVKLVD